MALSSSTNPVLDGLQNLNSNVTAGSTDAGANTIFPAQKAITVTGSGGGTYAVLPSLADVPNGHEILINCASDSFLRTPASSDEKINDVDCDGANQYPLVATQVLKIIKVNNTVGWVAHELTALGATVTAVVPGAHSSSPSISPSVSPSKSPSVSPSASPSVSPSVSPSRSPSVSPSRSPSVSPSASVSPSRSPSVSPSASVSPSVSPSKSPSVSPSASPSVSPSFSPSENP